MISASALALSLNDLSQKDATGGLSNNPDVKIELPGKLGKVASKMKQFGMGDQVTQLETSMKIFV